MFSIVEVDESRSEDVEQLGTKTKYWLRSAQNKRILFKRDDLGIGEDWSEKIACELGALLGLPHVHYEMAVEKTSRKPGVISQSFVEEGSNLIHGNQLLFSALRNYPSPTKPKNTTSALVKDYTIDSVKEVISNLEIPIENWQKELPNGINTALDVFSGYILFDALIGNQDRHHENWGAIQQETHLYLAPIYDNAAGLARNLTDDKRKLILETKDRRQNLEAFANRALSAFFKSKDDKKRLSTFNAFLEISILVPEAKKIWLHQLRNIDRQKINCLLNQVPPSRMSEICRTFTEEYILINQKTIFSGVTK